MNFIINCFNEINHIPISSQEKVDKSSPNFYDKEHAKTNISINLAELLKTAEEVKEVKGVKSPYTIKLCQNSVLETDNINAKFITKIKDLVCKYFEKFESISMTSRAHQNSDGTVDALFFTIISKKGENFTKKDVNILKRIKNAEKNNDIEKEHSAEIFEDKGKIIVYVPINTYSKALEAKINEDMKSFFEVITNANSIATECKLNSSGYSIKYKKTKKAE